MFLFVLQGNAALLNCVLRSFQVCLFMLITVSYSRNVKKKKYIYIEYRDIPKILRYFYSGIVI